LHLQGTWTDGETDRAIPIYPLPNFACGGYKKEKKKKTKQKTKKERKKKKQTNKQTKNNPQHNNIYSARSGTDRLYFTPKNSLEREITFFLHI
jgi:hypothetical protein